MTPGDINISGEETRHTFIATKDVRDKYVASRMLWDLGLLEEARHGFDSNPTALPDCHRHFSNIIGIRLSLAFDFCIIFDCH